MSRSPSGRQYQHLDVVRQQGLLRKTALDGLVEEVLAGAVVEHINLREVCREAKLEKIVAHRVSFVLRLASDSSVRAADSLMNGAYGLRARYCQSPSEGTAANSAICRTLADAIRSRTIETESVSLEKQLVALSDALGDSLAMLSAKVWFDAATDKRAPTSADGQVLSDVWSQSRDEPERVKAALPELSSQQVEHSLAKGCSVPAPVAIDVKGAFVDSKGIEYVPASKKTRPLQIHLMGWT